MLVWTPFFTQEIRRRKGVRDAREIRERAATLQKVADAIELDTTGMSMEAGGGASSGAVTSRQQGAMKAHGPTARGFLTDPSPPW